MKLPSVGDRFTRPGCSDVVITNVTSTTISYARHPYVAQLPIAEFMAALETTLANSLKLAIEANLNNITDDTEV